MAVLMVTGNTAIIPNPIWNVLSSVRTLTGTLGIEMGDVEVGSTHYHALFGVAVVLLIITLIINMSAVAILSYIKEGRMGSRAKRPLIQSRNFDLVKEKLQSWFRIILLALLALLLLVAGLWEVVLIIILADCCLAPWQEPDLKAPYRAGSICLRHCCCDSCFSHSGNNSELYYCERIASDIVAIPDAATHRSWQKWRHFSGDCRNIIPGCRSNCYCPPSWCRSGDLFGRIYP